MFTHVQCCDIVPSLVSSFGESLDTGLYFAPQLPRGFDHFYGAGRGGEPPPPHSAGRGGASIPDFNLTQSHSVRREHYFRSQSDTCHNIDQDGIHFYILMHADERR